jgi:hypothetical protein
MRAIARKSFASDKKGSGAVVTNGTLDDCHAHIAPADRAVACGLLIREQWRAAMLPGGMRKPCSEGAATST